MKYTPEDKLEQMTTQLLESMFQIVYEGQHNQEFSRCRTVMLAYDDAIHGIMGKAEKVIGQLEELKGTLEGKVSVLEESNKGLERQK